MHCLSSNFNCSPNSSSDWGFKNPRLLTFSLYASANCCLWLLNVASTFDIIGHIAHQQWHFMYAYDTVPVYLDERLAYILGLILLTAVLWFHFYLSSTPSLFKYKISNLHFRPVLFLNMFCSSFTAVHLVLYGGNPIARVGSGAVIERVTLLLYKR